MCRILISTFLALVVTFASLQQANAVASIAFGQGPDGSWVAAYSTNKTNDRESVHEAMSRCSNANLESAARNCQIVVTAHNWCFALAVMDRGNGSNVRTNADLETAKKEAIGSCQRTKNASCSVKLSFCDTVSPSVLLCTQPIFVEEIRLRALLNESDLQITQAAEKINYLRSRYCRHVEQASLPDNMLRPDYAADISSKCTMYSAMFRGERVYFSQCFEEGR